eukprot:gene24894-28140_t
MNLTGGDSANVLDASGFEGEVALSGGAGDDTLVGTAQADVLSGGAGRNLIHGGGGQDRVAETAFGRGLAQTVVLTHAALTYTENGAAWLSNDFTGSMAGNPFTSSITAATLMGDTGNDVIDASAFSAGSVSLFGQEGADTLRGGSGNDILSGDKGGDALYGNAGTDTVLEFGASRYLLTTTTLDASDGSSAALTLTRPSSGHFTLTLQVTPQDQAQTTSALAAKATESDIRAALTALEGVASSDIEVEILSSTQVKIELTGRLAGQAVSQFTAQLTSPAATSISTWVNGAALLDTLDAIESAQLISGVGASVIDATDFTPTSLEGVVTLIGSEGSDRLTGSLTVRSELNGRDGNDQLVLRHARGQIDGGGGWDVLELKAVGDVRAAAGTGVNPSDTRLTVSPQGGADILLDTWGVEHLLLNAMSAQALGQGSVLDVSGFGGRIEASTELSLLSQGLGLMLDASADIAVQLRDASVLRFELGPLATIGELVEQLSVSGQLKTELSADGQFLVMTDLTSGSAIFQVTDLGESSAAQQLGLTVSASGGVITGAALTPGIWTTELIGSTGADTLTGSAGDDLLLAGAGDRVTGGDGKDTLQFVPSGSLTASNTQVAWSGGTQTVSMASIEALKIAKATSARTADLKAFTGSVWIDTASPDTLELGPGKTTVNLLVSALKALPQGSQVVINASLASPPQALVTRFDNADGASLGLEYGRSNNPNDLSTRLTLNPQASGVRTLAFSMPQGPAASQ